MLDALGYGRNISEGGIKALTIAAGGLSGGISSSIAGGNFWAGVRQGLITSGLNHMMHMVAEGIEGGYGDCKDKEKALQHKKAAQLLEKLNLTKMVVSEILLESTEVGDFTLRKLREEIVDIYGDEKSKKVNEVYSMAVDVFKEVESTLKAAFPKQTDKITDVFKFKMSVGLAASASCDYIQSKVQWQWVKFYCKDIYYEQFPSLKPKAPQTGGKFGGGGASTSY